jgi:hypothetical protein
MTIYAQARLLGASNDVAQLTALMSSLPTTSPDRQYVADLALIGASDTRSKEAGQWAVKNGATELWGIQQSESLWRKVGNDQNRGLRMLGGPGEVKKGTFAGLAR